MTTMRLMQRGVASREGIRTMIWTTALLLGLVLLYLPFTTGSTSMLAWTWPIGGVLLFLSVRGIGNASGGVLGETARGRDDEVGRWLGQLGGRCQVLRYVTAGGRSVEYAVVAPSGVYAMQTRNVRGTVSVRGDTVLLNDRPLPAETTSRVVADAHAIEEYLSRAGFHQKVRPLLVFTDARTDVRETSGVTMLPLRWLESYVRTRPQVLSAIDCGVLGGALRREARAVITR